MLSFIFFSVSFIAMSELFISAIKRHISVCFSRTSAIRTHGPGVVPVRGMEVTCCESPLTWLCGAASVAHGGCSDTGVSVS